MDCKNMKVELPSRHFMPLIGFGTFQIRGSTLIRDVLDYALGSGYRQIDSAAVYGNEQDIGTALKELLPKHKLTRQDIFITSKLSPSDQGDKALQALKQSIKNLDCGYLDLYLIHWPGAHGIPGTHPDNIRLRELSWKKLSDGVQQGLVRDIGVSNYEVRHLQEIFNNGGPIKPAVNQVEWHPHCYNDELHKFCIKEGIHLQAYSSLGGSNNPSLINDKEVEIVAKKLQKSPAQVLLRWALQQEIGIIPKARSMEHIQSNIELNFIIPQESMVKLNNLKTRERYAWNPNKII